MPNAIWVQDFTSKTFQTVIMAQNTYYPEEVLIEKMERGEYGWLDYVNHFSAEWQEELVEYCKAHSLTIDDTAAEQFVHYKSEQLEAAMESGEA